MGLIERRSHGNAVDYALKDRFGREIGTTSGYWHLAERTKPPRTDTWSRLRKASHRSVAGTHVFELVDPHVSPEFRALLLAAAAAYISRFRLLSKTTTTDRGALARRVAHRALARATPGEPPGSPRGIAVYDARGAS